MKVEIWSLWSFCFGLLLGGYLGAHDGPPPLYIVAMCGAVLFSATILAVMIRKKDK